MTDWVNLENVIDKRDESQDAIIHEMGHWANRYFNGGIDRCHLSNAYEKEWIFSYQEFGGSIKNYDSVEEFGTSVFEYYLLEPERFEKVAPYTCFFEAFLNESLDRTYLENVNDGSYDFSRIKL